MSPTPSIERRQMNLDPSGSAALVNQGLWTRRELDHQPGGKPPYWQTETAGQRADQLLEMKITQIYEGTNQIQRVVMARQLLGG
ncbi:hypothetical protein [Frankia sp. Cas3]|uniref:hypothetical protein n=1 Tax=Frankia sp. Cas3 TaxID=3073926 RepID=UPI003A100E91